ncbi:MAG: cytochrome c5 family protein [Betaproteobacteria bacterium]|nr:MAG: cytochrome c5 family protein [Betaproteobacteria bacterium]
MNKSILVFAAALATLLSACGGQDSGKQAAAPAAPAAPAAAPAPAAPAPVAAAPAANAVGESVYKKTCALCHASGVAGAPIPGNKADWEPRIAQGKDILYKHALEGFTGAKGMMPPRGGSTSLTDDEVKAGVDFMVSKLQ